MEDIAWKKDKTPYVVYACKKCRQYMYAKTIQKSKKCVRCGRIHTMSSILKSGDIVLGISTAVDMVKQKQDEFAINELGTRPNFRTLNDFTIRTFYDSKREEEVSTEYEGKFKKILRELSRNHDSFPLYIVEIMAENYGIPISEVKILTRNFQKQGILLKQKDLSYKIKTSE